MKIIVTGGAGFIGSHIVDAYIAAGNEGIVLDDMSAGHAEHLNPRAKFIELDIRDEKGVGRVFSDFHPDIIDHHAAQIDIRRSVADPVFDASVNILGSLSR